MKTYRAKLKSRKRIMVEIPREQQGWWADVRPGQTLTLRDATESDIARCFINEGQSRDPADYLCETCDRGALVKRIAVETLTEVRNCHACKHLEWADDDSAEGSTGDSGWCCNKRDDGGANRALLAKLEKEPYRNRYKRCFEQVGVERKAP
jgi:hypothetical protein